MHTFNNTIFSKTILSIGVLLRIAGFILIFRAIVEILILKLVDFPTDFATHPEKIASIPHIQLILTFAQSSGMFIGFILLPFLYVTRFRSQETPDHLFNSVPSLGLFMIASVGLLLVSLPLIEQFILMNQEMTLPSSMKPMEELLKALEENAKVLTDILITYHNAWSFTLVFITIAVLPAIGEELVFRGILQRELATIWQNKHFAIWISGFIFSFIHFQFYGFIPRMLLGVLFGYCYLWTGSLWVPIVMHFTNNTLTLWVSAFMKDSFLNTSQQENAVFDIRFFMPYIVAEVLFLFLYYKFIRQRQASV